MSDEERELVGKVLREAAAESYAIENDGARVMIEGVIMAYTYTDDEGRPMIGVANNDTLVITSLGLADYLHHEFLAVIVGGDDDDDD